MTKIHPFTGAWPVFLREMLILRRRMPKQLASWLVSPLLYFTAFTCAMGGVTVNGLPYIDFLVPGLVAMASMTQAWAIAVDINIARFYWHMLDEFMTCPLSASGYVAGETAAGIVRAMGASVIIMIIGTLAGVHVNLLAPGLWLALVLNAWFFSGLAIMMAMLVKSHADQALLSNFVITPMAFLGGTFSPWNACRNGPGTCSAYCLFPTPQAPCRQPPREGPSPGPSWAFSPLAPSPSSLAPSSA